MGSRSYESLQNTRDGAMALIALGAALALASSTVLMNAFLVNNRLVFVTSYWARSTSGPIWACGAILAFRFGLVLWRKSLQMEQELTVSKNIADARDRP